MTGRSSLLLLLALLAVVPVVSAPQDDPPTYIVWPKQWHADVMIADNGFWPFQVWRGGERIRCTQQLSNIDFFFFFFIFFFLLFVES